MFVMKALYTPHNFYKFIFKDLCETMIGKIFYRLNHSCSCFPGFMFLRSIQCYFFLLGWKMKSVHKILVSVTCGGPSSWRLLHLMCNVAASLTILLQVSLLGDDVFVHMMLIWLSLIKDLGRVQSGSENCHSCHNCDNSWMSDKNMYLLIQCPRSKERSEAQVGEFDTDLFIHKQCIL